jgi:adenylate cyclase
MTAEKFKRKLTAILSADVKGYSRLMGTDEEATLRTLQEYKEVMASSIQHHRGRIVGGAGDSLLAEFASVVDAVQCAVEIQQVLRAKNALLPEDRRMEFRIGINLGDVIEEGDTIYGDGVNIAARVEGLADAGGICISESAYQQIENKLPLRYDYVGEHEVKNIAKPVRVYRARIESEATKEEKGLRRKERGKRPLALGVLAAFGVVVAMVVLWQFILRPSPLPMEKADPKKMAFPLPDKPSIAVLPFANLSGDSTKDYLSDGLTEEIINALSKIPTVFVIARNSTFTYKGKPLKIQQVAEEMGVQYVLEGSVQWSGDRVRIMAQLVDALKGHHLFSERYDRELKDIFALQDEISMQVLTAMRVTLTSGERARGLEKETKNLDAYLKLLQAWVYMGVVNKENIALSRKLAEEALALDPGYASAYAAIAMVNLQEVYVGISNSPRESLDRAEGLAKKALALNDSHVDALCTLSLTYVFKRQFDKAVLEAEKAVALGPNSANAYFTLGTALYHSDRFEEAIPHLNKSLRLSPIPIGQCLNSLAGTYRFLGRYDEAIATYKKLLQLYPNYLPAQINLTSTYVLAGREEEARAAAAEVMRIDPGFSLERWAKTHPLRQERVNQLVEAWRKAGLK